MIYEQHTLLIFEMNHLILFSLLYYRMDKQNQLKHPQKLF